LLVNQLKNWWREKLKMVWGSILSVWVLQRCTATGDVTLAPKQQAVAATRTTMTRQRRMPSAKAVGDSSSAAASTAIEVVPRVVMRRV